MMSTRFPVSNMGILVVTVQSVSFWEVLSYFFTWSTFFFVHQLCKDPHLIACLQYIFIQDVLHTPLVWHTSRRKLLCQMAKNNLIINLQNGEILSTCMGTHILIQIHTQT